MWGYTLENTYVMTREAFLSCGKLLTYKAAVDRNLLVKLSHVRLDSTVLYVSHGVMPGSATEPDVTGETYLQVRV